MKINRKNAMTLWKKRYGNQQKVKDFAGREMALCAYGDSSNKFGWNIDHVVPLSLNGGNCDDNLVCCNMKTNHDKSDGFPEFVANSKEFEIVKENKKITIVEKIVEKKSGQGNRDYLLGLTEGMIKTVLALKSCGKKDEEIAKIILDQFDLSFC